MVLPLWGELGDLEQMMGERGVSVDHSTIYRWVQKYGSVANFCRGRTKTLIGTSSGLSDRFELEPLIENLDRLGQSRQTQAEGALDDASLATNVIRYVEG